MATSPGFVSDGGGLSPTRNKKSYAALLASNLPTSANKNVLEVTLEKDQKGSFNVSVEDCARMMSKIGIDSNIGANVESVQICPNGRGIVFITLKDTVPIEKFCHHDVIQVSQSGIRAIHVKPAG